MITDNKDVLYIFLHIPKCAGTTFAEHLKYNFQQGTLLNIGPSLHRPFEERSEVDAYIRSLHPKRKEKIKVISGHSVYFGIHEHFQRPARYITFLRDPLWQAISLYNYFMEHYDFVTRNDHGGKFSNDNGELTFEKWQHVFDINMQISALLNYRINNQIGLHGDIKINEDHLEKAKQVLDRFYFVGLTETFEEDSSFLFNELNITKFIKKPQNVTPKRHIRPSTKLFDLISQSATLDQQLYSHAVQLNRDFKQNHPEFYKIVKDTDNRKTYLPLPLKLIVAEKLVAFFGLGTLARLQSIKSRIRELMFSLLIYCD